MTEIMKSGLQDRRDSPQNEGCTNKRQMQPSNAPLFKTTNNLKRKYDRVMRRYPKWQTVLQRIRTSINSRLFFSPVK